MKDGEITPPLTMAEIEKITANSLRVDILLHLLAHEQLTLSEITMLIGRSKSAMSRQMKQLVQFAMVEEFEQDLNNPGSPHKAYKVSQSFQEAFIRFRVNPQFNDSSAAHTYISYMMGMNAVSKRLQDLTKIYLEEIAEVTNRSGSKLSNTQFNALKQKFINTGVVFVAPEHVERVQDILERSIADIIEITKSSDEPKDYLISVGMYPYKALLDD